MARRAHQDSQQELAVTSGRKQEEFDALKASRHMTHEIPNAKLAVGMFIATAHNRQGKVIRCEKVTEVEWSRKGEWCKVNNKYVYTSGGRAEILYTAQEIEDFLGIQANDTVEAYERALMAELFPELLADDCIEQPLPRPNEKVS